LKTDIRALKRQAGIRPFAVRGFAEGKNHRCPFHDDTNPSFAVLSGDDGFFFKCQACDKSGDVLKFVELMDKVDFKTALATVKKEIGWKDEETEYKEFAYDQSKAVERLSEALEYLAARGISEDTARNYNLGVVDHPSIGLALAMPYEEQDGKIPAKLRSLDPAQKKFTQLKGLGTDSLLFGLHVLDFLYDSELWITESELDAMMLVSHGRNAISVSSATSSLDREGKLKFAPELIEKISKSADHIFIITDMDEPGRKNANAWLNTLPPHKAHLVEWKYDGKNSGQPKDIGDVYKKDPAKFETRLEELRKHALRPAYLQVLKRLSELDGGDPVMVIEQTLIEGTTMIGALSGAGKTWFALSMAKAITNGTPFLGRFAVKEPRHVIYMVPEAGARGFRRRAAWMGVKEERFLCRTQTEGAALSLSDPKLLMAIRELKPVVFLDTAIRFQMAKDENSASENAVGLATAFSALIAAGAVAVVGLHHSAKQTREHNELFLETALRGTGDLGAMADCVWAIQWDNGGPNLKGAQKEAFEKQSRELMRLWVKCVKPRDIEPEPEPLRLQGRSETGLSYLSSEGDFKVLSMADLPVSDNVRLANELDVLTDEDPTRSLSSLMETFEMKGARIKKLLKTKDKEFVAGEKGKSGYWRKTLPGQACQFEEETNAPF